MDISKMKHVFLGAGDGQSVAMIVDKTAYLVQCDGMGDALQLMKKKYNIPTSDWKLSNAKAVIIPGVWEYPMATFQGAA